MVGCQTHAPEGYRFLFQCIGAKRTEEARTELVSIFGSWKGKACKLVQGVYRPIDPNRTYKGPWTFRPNEGYMAFLPEAFREEQRT